jgi:hypothetical protein
MGVRKIKMYKTYFKIILIIVILLSGACTSPTKQPTLLETTLPTPIFTPTSFPSQTSNSSNGKWWTQVPDPPTLSPDVQDELYDLLKSNGNCKLPCFLGITPDKTSLADAKAILEKFDVRQSISIDEIASTKTYEAYNAQIFTNKDVTLAMNLRLEVKNQIVSRLTVNATPSRNGYSVTDDQHLSQYSLREVFLKHGPPDAVYLQPPTYGEYGLQVVYEKLKMVIEITGSAKDISNGKYEICPNLGDGDITSMKIALASPLDSTDVKTLIGYPFWENVPAFEETSGLSIKDFYQLMTNEKQPACFESK